VRRVPRAAARGQAMVEFALIFPIFIAMVLGVFDAGRLVYTQNTIGNASREGARVAIVNQHPTAIDQHTRETMLGVVADPSVAQVTVSYAGTQCVPAPIRIGCQVTVTVTYSWRAITPVIGSLIGPRILTASTTMPVERVFSAAPQP
jgi:Flp pilus assembly protein TadG